MAHPLDLRYPNDRRGMLSFTNILTRTYWVMHYHGKSEFIVDLNNDSRH
eukprot:SAG11_NODE_13425_length_655_cov_2.120504_1_plen_48_part_10